MLCNIPVMCPEREEEERIALEKREQEEAAYNEKLKKLDEIEEKKRQREIEIEERRKRDLEQGRERRYIITYLCLCCKSYLSWYKQVTTSYCLCN